MRCYSSCYTRATSFGRPQSLAYSVRSGPCRRSAWWRCSQPSMCRCWSTWSRRSRHRRHPFCRRFLRRRSPLRPFQSRHRVVHRPGPRSHRRPLRRSGQPFPWFRRMRSRRRTPRLHRNQLRHPSWSVRPTPWCRQPRCCRRTRYAPRYPAVPRNQSPHPSQLGPRFRRWRWSHPSRFLPRPSCRPNRRFLPRRSCRPNYRW